MGSQAHFAHSLVPSFSFQYQQAREDEEAEGGEPRALTACFAELDKGASTRCKMWLTNNR